MEFSASSLIIGAGPAGLAAAIGAGKGSLLLERNALAGKKLLLSGSGQCNFTNDLSKPAFLAACAEYAHFLKPALYRFDNAAFIGLLESAGCPTLTRPDGKVFPASLHSADVRNALLKTALDRGARIRYGIRIVAVEQQDDFILRAENGETFRSSRLILASGGASYPQTGSDGSAFALAKSLGHSVIPPAPALAAVDIAAWEPFRSCAGVSLRSVQAILHTAGGKKRVQGDLLWTHTGLSGPLILDNSWRLRPGDVVELNLLPDAQDRLPGLITLHPRNSLFTALKRLGLPASLLQAILDFGEVYPAQTCAEVTKATRLKTISLLSSLKLSVAAVESLQTSMATCGGIPLAEVKAHSLTSKLCPGLYFAGEILDYNLPTGGFNIQMAVSTGFLAGSSAVDTK